MIADAPHHGSQLDQIKATIDLPNNLAHKVIHPHPLVKLESFQVDLLAGDHLARLRGQNSEK